MEREWDADGQQDVTQEDSLQRRAVNDYESLAAVDLLSLSLHRDLVYPRASS